MYKLDGLWIDMIGIYAKVCFCDHQKQIHYFANKGSSSQGYGFSCGHVWLWELDCEEGWAPKNWCFWTVVLEKTLDSPLDCKEIKPVNPKGNQSRMFIGRTDAEAEAPSLWPPNEKSWLRNDWCWERLKVVGEGHEMIGWHHWPHGHEFEKTLGDGEGQGSLGCCSPWGHKELETTEDWRTNVCFEVQLNVLNRQDLLGRI